MSEVTLPDAPAIDGLRFRTYRGAEDVPAMVVVQRAAQRADGDTEVWSEESMRLDLENPTHGDPADDVLLAFLGDRMVAYSRVGWEDASQGERTYWSFGRVHPDWRRRGIGTAMLGHDERRRREIAAGHETTAPLTLLSWVSDNDAGAIALLTKRGYRRVRTYHHMVRPDLDDVRVPPLPEGLEVRPITPDLLPTLWAAMEEAFRDHFGGQDFSPEAFRRWSLDPDFDASLLVVALDGDEVAGGVQGQIIPVENELNGYLRGWVDPVFTRRAWRRRGVASALLGRALVVLRDRGMTSAQLGVDSENANDAEGLYERHGFRVVRSSSEWHRPLAL